MVLKDCLGKQAEDSPERVPQNIRKRNNARGNKLKEQNSSLKESFKQEHSQATFMECP
jgi:hypothetical protein